MILAALIAVNAEISLVDPKIRMDPKISMIEFAIANWKATPKMQIQDAYKWLYHAALGADHAVPNDKIPRKWMEREWGTLTEPMPGEPLETELRPDGAWIRVNLRPYKASGGDPETLLQLFVQSARQFPARNAAFKTAWSQLGNRLRRAPVLELNYAGWREFDHKMKALSYPACHHSEAYERAYRPAYRVIRRAIWDARPR